MFVSNKLQVAETMRERYYPSFLVSDLYDRLIKRDEPHSQSRCSPEEKGEGVSMHMHRNETHARMSYFGLFFVCLHEFIVAIIIVWCRSVCSARI